MSGVQLTDIRVLWEGSSGDPPRSLLVLARPVLRGGQRVVLRDAFAALPNVQRAMLVDFDGCDQHTAVRIGLAGDFRGRQTVVSELLTRMALACGRPRVHLMELAPVRGTIRPCTITQWYARLRACG